MKIYLFALTLYGLCASLMPQTSLACTSFLIDQAGYHVLGKNFDSFVSNALLIVNKRSVLKTAFEIYGETDIGELAKALVDAATIVIASPTVLVGPHPSIVHAVYLANALRPKLRYASIIGTYGWGSKMVDNISNMITNLKVEIIEPVIVKGYPKEYDYKMLDKLAESILIRHRNL